MRGYSSTSLPADASTDPEVAPGEEFPFVNNPSPDDVEILEQLYGTRKRMRIVMLGAGMSGLNFLKFAEDRLESVEIVCYESLKEVGGTWLANRYPGCAW
jgi:hypothetical protein